ncbi:MAG: hypothetical protein FWF50_03500 [Defluviitaleaceae bacterium]|nr:hypothetical protein [Defluviitaleaceae bacterium]
MKYFLLDINRNLLKSPRILSSFGVINKRDVNLKDHKSIEKRTLFYIESNLETIFTGVIVRPFFMLSETLFDITKKYEPKLIMKQIILLDVENKISNLYYMPILSKIDCAVNITKDKPTKPILNKKKLPKKSIFEVKGFGLPVVRLDLAESFLRREERGVNLIPLEVE